MKIKNEQGEEIEVFTSQEVEQKAKAAAEEAAKKAIEDFKAANPDKTQELEELKTKLTDVEAALQAAESAGGDNKGQVERLRRERDEAREAAKKAQEDIDKKFEEFKKEVTGDTKTELLDKLAGNDAELRKKIELEFNSYRPNDNSKKGIQERMEKAFQLATGDKAKPGIFDGSTGGGDRGEGGGYKPPEKKELNPNQKAIGNVLGITQKDREDYEKFQAEQNHKRAQGLIP